MRVLTISRGTLELARVHLTRPFATIGRSPTCDVVLRASGIAPIHFLMEWVGSGAFNPAQGSWSIFDISKSVDSSGEGVMLGKEPVKFEDLQFRWTEDTLQNAPEIGGSIRASLTGDAGGKLTAGAHAPLLEVVQIRSDSGAIEEVIHVEPASLSTQSRPLEKFPEFRIEATGKEGATAVRLLLEEMPGAQVLRRGSPLSPKDLPELRANDFLEVLWNGNRFYLRFVEKTEIPAVPRGTRDPLFFKISLFGGLGALAIVGIATVILQFQTPPPPPPPPRIATVEVKSVTPPPPPPPAEKAPPPPVQEKPIAPGLKTEAKHVEPKKAGPLAAPTFKKESKAPSKRAGLNSPAKETDVNKMGILGALKGSGPKGPGVRADMILNQGVISQTPHDDSDDAKIVLKNPPSGTIGSGRSGSRNGKSDLAAASTTLGNRGSANPESSGAIAGEGGKPGYTQGSAIGGAGKGVGQGGNAFGELDAGSAQVSGGLDRETVRRIILQYRSQIRTCYEKAMLSNPRLAGRVTYDWTISPTGPVINSKITKSTANSPVLEGCVHDVIRSMKFPAARNGRPTIVIYPFVFQARS